MSYAHLSTDERRIAVRLVLDEEMTYEFTARVLHCSKATIANIIARFRSTGEIEEVHPGGRERLLDPIQMNILQQHITQHRNATAVGLQHILPPSAPPLSERTLQRYRRELDMTPRRRRLTARQSGEYHQQRWEWAWEHRRDQAFLWLHTDECTVRMQDTGDIIWVKRGEPTPPFEVATLRCHVNIWGVVWDEGSIFAQFDGHLNTDLFIELLEEHLLPLKENLVGRTLLIDQHSVHKTKTVKDWLTSHSFSYLFLPTHSPRFNGIEECWSWMKRWVRKLSPRDENELRLAIQEASELLPQDVIRAHLGHAQRSIRDYAYGEDAEE